MSEIWLNGHERQGDTVYVLGQMRCAGCGAYNKGIVTVYLDPDDVIPPEPDFPFKYGDCPVCRKEIYQPPPQVEELTPERLSQLPLEILRKAIAIKKSVRADENPF